MPRTTILVGLILLLGVGTSSAQEEITFTTYYPSPHGVYRNLRLFPDDGSTMSCDANNEGVMYYDSTDNIIKVCVDTGGGTYDWQPMGGGLWQVDATDAFIHPIDTNWKVSMGASDNWANLYVVSHSNTQANIRSIGPGGAPQIKLQSPTGEWYMTIPSDQSYLRFNQND